MSYQVYFANLAEENAALTVALLRLKEETNRLAPDEAQLLYALRGSETPTAMPRGRAGAGLAGLQRRSAFARRWRRWRWPPRWRSRPAGRRRGRAPPTAAGAMAAARGRNTPLGLDGSGLLLEGGQALQHLQQRLGPRHVHPAGVQVHLLVAHLHPMT